MKIALFSDIHANLPALEACLEDMDNRGPDAIYCLGDLVGYNIWPNEVINMIRRRGIPCIAGNYDQGVGRSSEDCGCAYKTDEEKAMGAISIALSNELVKDKERKYLRTLPSHLQLEYQFNDGPLNIFLAHGSPRKINEYLFEDREEKSIMRIMEGVNADILCVGHTHRPYHRTFSYARNNRTACRHTINLGSVGKPKDGDNRACYVLLELDEESSPFAKDSIRVEFIRVNYDFEKAAQAIEKSILPKAYADMVRKGY
jgi:putative phosphoesterase